MKRKQLTLLLLLMVGVALWLTRGRWLPLLLRQLPLLKDQSEIIQALEALASLAVLALNALFAYLLWLSQQDKRENETQRSL